MKSRNLVLAAAGLGLALAGIAPVTAVAATSGDVSVQEVHRKSAKCVSPADQKINISWGDGSVTTTVYYNNHCNQARAIELEFVRENGERFNKCFVAPAKKKSSKEIDNSNPNKVSILNRASCP
ncbi:hypothetical protein AB0M48_04160 [Lentzea sp. NPDC051208]|uniref:hypothetical protein n=1 Tax=Lentzea sp. NPDC051208 TaxID=3154642 RepID=UPI003421B711